MPKPQFLRESSFDELDEYASGLRTQSLPIKQTLKVNLKSARGWTKGWGMEEAPDVYCVVSIAGGPKQDRGHRKSKTANNTKAPQFNETFSFPLAVPELAVVTLEFWDDDTSEWRRLPRPRVAAGPGGQDPRPWTSPCFRSLTLWTKGGGQAFVKVSFDFEEASRGGRASVRFLQTRQVTIHTTLGSSPRRRRGAGPPPAPHTPLRRLRRGLRRLRRDGRLVINCFRVQQLGSAASSISAEPSRPRPFDWLPTHLHRQRRAAPRELACARASRPSPLVQAPADL